MQFHHLVSYTGEATVIDHVVEYINKKNGAANICGPTVGPGRRQEMGPEDVGGYEKREINAQALGHAKTKKRGDSTPNANMPSQNNAES